MPKMRKIDPSISKNGQMWNQFYTAVPKNVTIFILHLFIPYIIYKHCVQDFCISIVEIYVLYCGSICSFFVIQFMYWLKFLPKVTISH